MDKVLDFYDLSLDLENRLITPKTEFSSKDLYIRLKELWRWHDDLLPYPFPMTVWERHYDLKHQFEEGWQLDGETVAHTYSMTIEVTEIHFKEKRKV